MNERDVQALQGALELAKKELDLALAIDRICDTVPEPMAMLASIVNLLADELEADFCLLSLLDQETGEVELKALNNRRQKLSTGQALSRARELAEQAVQLDSVTIWEGRQVLPPELHAALPPHIQFAAVPIILGKHRRLGALLLGRSVRPFSPDDVNWLKIAEAYIDSAVIQGYAYYELQQRTKELETIYRVDHIRDMGLPFDDMLNTVLQTICATIEAEMGFVMLYDQSGQHIEMRAATHEDLFHLSRYYELINQVAHESLRQGELVCYNALGEALQAIMCLPLILNHKIIGVLGVAHSEEERGFRADDRRLLSAIGSQIDTAIFESLEIRRLRQVLGRSVDPNIMERLLAASDRDFLAGERLVASVLYADVRGSTQLAEQVEPEQLVEFINAYLGKMTEVILAHEGTLDKFVGDEVMALFGAPFPQEDHALRAVRTGLAMQAAHQRLVDTWKGLGGKPVPPIGIGVATGEMIVGEMGSPQRTDYTAIGRAVNLGARICSAAKAGDVLISQATYDLAKAALEASPVSGLHFKGVAGEVTVYRVERVL
jgi:adenylate cyclase